MFATGSTSDHIWMIGCLGRYEQAERIATLMGNGFFDDLADEAHERLTEAALRCGHDLGSRSDTVVSFAKKRAATFVRMTRGEP